MRRYGYKGYEFEPDPEWNGKNWIAGVVVSSEDPGWPQRKRITGELTFETQAEAFAESISLGQRVIDSDCVWYRGGVEVRAPAISPAKLRPPGGQSRRSRLRRQKKSGDLAPEVEFQKKEVSECQLR